MIHKKSLTISDANPDVIIALNSNSTVIINELREIIYQKDEEIALLKAHLRQFKIKTIAVDHLHFRVCS